MKTFYCNASVYTGTLPLQQAFGVEDGRFCFAGSNDDAAAMACPEDRIIDLGGAFVCSGFNDSHMHLFSYGTALSQALLAEHTESLSGMLSYLRDFLAVSGLKEGGWLLGRGWNQDYFSDVHRLPDRHDLDSVTTDFPVVIMRACGHCLVVNSRALELLHITGDTPSPEGGCIGLENGEPDGRFYDNALEIVISAVPLPDKEEVKRRLETACRALNSYGVTSSQTDDYCVYRNLPWELINQAYEELEAEGKLSVRVYQQANFTDTASLRDFISKGNVTGKGSDMFKIGPLKMLGDGALGARTAYISVPYADDPYARGIPVFTPQQLDEMIDLAVGSGMQVAVHAIGDACLDNVLSAYEKAFVKYNPADHRCGIVHCQVTRPEQLKKIAELKLHVYAQTIFLDYDINIIEARVGRQLAESSYRWKTLMNMGVSVSNGTDCPVELPDELRSMQCAVTRKTISGAGPYLEDEAFTVQEAIDSYTVMSARSSFEENTKGRIQPGMFADFTVLGQNPFDTVPEKLHAIPVIATYLGGNCVYHRSEG